MKNEMLNFINNEILKQARDLTYLVKADAPNDENALFNQTGLVVWSGESDLTIYQDENVNFAFRALHDALHLKTRLGFNPEHEILMGRIQASKQSSRLMSELVYCEVALQAEHFQKTGQFVYNQVEFTISHLKICGLL